MKMDKDSRKAARDMVVSDLTNFQKGYQDLLNSWRQKYQEDYEFLKDYAVQITSESSDIPPKTPKATRKRITSIPEDDAVSISSIESENKVTEPSTSSSRPKREASTRATADIRAQQMQSLNQKLRMPSVSSQKSNKRAKHSVTSEEEEEVNEDTFKKPSKQPKKKKMALDETLDMKTEEKTSEPRESKKKKTSNTPKKTPKKSKTSRNQSRTVSTASNEAGNLDKSVASRTRSRIPSIDTANGNKTLVNEEDVVEPSVYEDAIAKIPMNSTMNPNSTMTFHKRMMNATVVLDKIPKTSDGIPAMNVTHVVSNPVVVNKYDVNDLITDDESSPERKNATYVKNTSMQKRKRIKSTSTDSEDEVSATPPPKRAAKDQKTADSKYKTNILFSPYSKDPVKKRVEAFEQATSSKTTVIDDEKTPVRVTRTKTKAMNAVEVDKKEDSNKKTESEEEKENTLLSLAAKNPQVKLDQLKVAKVMTTPLTKYKLKMPMSVSRIPHTPVNTGLLPSRAMTASKVTNVTASIESTQKLTKTTSTDNLADKRLLKTTVEEDDAVRKKQEALKALTEEKRRKREEKEMKNKLAREAKEKFEAERRAKLEKEREEKARQAELIAKKQREEAEKKKIALALKAEIKEKKKREEEMIRQQKLQEQEEIQRLLNEQKRREQEAEKRRIAEERAVQAAANEAAKVKQQYQAKVKTMQQKQFDPNSYALDSEPDEASDDEVNPKHPIPFWSRSDQRNLQLEIQKNVPLNLVCALFKTKATTLDLKDVFVNIRKDKLKRTSSAQWSCPRFSMMQSFTE